MFKTKSDFEPTGDQAPAISSLSKGIENGETHQTLLGVTGSGKTFTVAKIIENIQRPTLVIAHNKTLAAQLYSEFKEFFPDNAVEYFVSYYDYFQPEAYLPTTDTYIEKDSSINDEISKLRLSTTRSLMERRDVIVVASVSCIYGLGNPFNWGSMAMTFYLGQQLDRKEMLAGLIKLQYERNDIDCKQGSFRVRGDTIEIYSPLSDLGLRVELFGDEIDRITEFDSLTGHTINVLENTTIYGTRHYVMPENEISDAIIPIESEMKLEVNKFKLQGKLLEAQRLEQRTNFDIEMLREIGHCAGIENYSRHLDKRQPGESPYTLLDFFPDDYVVIIDESHVTLPQIKAMNSGDRARKDALVSNGFRLPSAYDNRPLNMEEFLKHNSQTIYVSATPGNFEIENSTNIVEQVIRPTGLVDPEIDIRPLDSQVDDLINEIRQEVALGNRVLAITLTKRTAEDLTDYLMQLDIKARYMHSDINTTERISIIRDLRLGHFDVLIGINLLREGLDLPEVTLVAILDADKEGFLRSERALIQTIGRASRNANGRVIMYADKITDSIKKATDETRRRRLIQNEYNRQHNITPATIIKPIRGLITKEKEKTPPLPLIVDPQEEIKSLEIAIQVAIKELDFENAAVIRDRIKELQ